jgi:hypothetical protein
MTTEPAPASIRRDLVCRCAQIRAQMGQVPLDHHDARKPVGWGEHPHDCDCGECP